MNNHEYYNQIFKRKSFHIFKDTEKLSSRDLEELEFFIKNNIISLYDDIKFEIKVVPERDTNCKRDAEYCVLFYSEIKDDYLRNIGYIGEQIDLYLVSKNIGSLWFGIGKPNKNYEEISNNNLEYVIMILISKMPEDKFRKDMFKSKRKNLEEIWSGDDLEIANITRFAPSACNTQPWFVENINNQELNVYRHEIPGKRGIMPINKVRYYNQIDIGIYLFILETCLNFKNYKYDRILYKDDINNINNNKILVAKYKFI